MSLISFDDLPPSGASPPSSQSRRTPRRSRGIYPYTLPGAPREFHRTPPFEGPEGIPQDVEELLTGSSAEEQLAWIATWTLMASRVCRMTFGDMVATGFLIGPDLVLTNDHNVNILKVDRDFANHVRFTFDYHEESPELPGAGVSYSLAADWLIDSSPPSPADEQPEPKTSEASRHELDYAVVRLDGAPAADIVDGRQRGVIELPSEPYVFTQGEPLIIVQHTFEEPLRTTLDRHGILSVNEGNTRVTYRTSTRDGASGSPCFNRDWRLVALHHGGSLGGWPPYSEGIPIHTIRKHLGAAALAALGLFKSPNSVTAPVFAPPA